MSDESKTPSSRPRILVVASLGAPPYIGGIENVVQTFLQSGLNDEFDFQVFDTYRYPDSNRWLLEKALFALRLPLQFFSSARRARPAAIHIHFSSEIDFWKHALCLLSARLLRFHTVFHLHGGSFDRFYGRLGPIRQGLARYILRRATLLIALSEYWREFLLSLAPDARIEILPNPIDPEGLVMKQDWIAELGEQSVLLLGSLGRRKGHYDAIKAFARVLESQPSSRLVFAGREEDAGATDELRALAKSQGVASSVVFAGPIAGEAKLRLMHRAAVHILPSYGENMPISVLEAMAIGKPVIATRVGAIPELLGVDDAGLVIEPGDWQSLATGIIELLNSPARAASLGAAAQQRVAERWHVDRIVPRLAALYSDVVES